jgi:hypothetical protein
VTLDKAIKIGKLILFVILIIGLPNLFWNIRIILQRGQDTMSEVKRASTTGADYMEFQTGQFRSIEYQKWLEASLQLPAVFKGSGQYINRFILPEFRGLAADGRAAVTELRGEITDLRRLTIDTNRSFNADGGLLQTSTATIGKVGSVLDEFAADLRGLVAEGVIAAQTANRILSDPNIPLIVQRFADGSLQFTEFVTALKIDAQDFDVAIKNFGELTALFNKYVKTANKWHKWVLLAQIVSLLSGLPRP